MKTKSQEYWFITYNTPEKEVHSKVYDSSFVDLVVSIQLYKYRVLFAKQITEEEFGAFQKEGF